MNLLAAAFKNFAVASLSAGYDAAATALACAAGDGAKLPAAPFNAVWWNATDYASPDLDPNAEIVYVSDRTGDNLTVARAREGTAAAAHNTAGKTYKLLATVTARVLQSSARLVLADGPLADVTGIVNSAYAAYTFPANFFAVGDTIRVISQWEHRPGSAFTAAPRIGFNMFGAVIMPQVSSYWSATEKTQRATALISIHDAAQMTNSGFNQRENGTLGGFATSQGLTTIDITVANTLQFNYRMDAAGETLRLGSFTVEVLRGG